MTPQERYDRAVRMALAALQFSASERIRIRDVIAGMTNDISKRLALTRLQGISRRDLNKLIKTVDAIVDNSMLLAFDDETFAQFWQLMAIQTARNVAPERDESDFPLIPAAGIGALLIVGGTVAAWRLRTTQSIKFRITAAIRQGVANGETAREILARIVGSQGIRRQVVKPVATRPVNIGGVKPTASGVAPNFSAGVITKIVADTQALSNTTIQALLMNARLAAFRRNSKLVKGIRQISTLDDRTTTTCIAYSDAAWTLDLVPIAPNTLPYNGGPPRHFNCRSIIVEIMRRNEAAVRQSFAVWLARQSREQQDAMLGKGRADLWRSGKITLSQLVSGDGQPLTLAGLRGLYG